MPIITCPVCGAKNRIDERADRLQPVCGRCGAKLSVRSSGDGGPITVTDATFADVISGARPVLVDCWAAWCGPCRMIAPALDQLAAESGGRYVVAKLNVDENPRTAQRFGITGIPALYIFERGQVVERLVGAQPISALRQALVRHVNHS